ncbi:MAG: DAK2 domain-containing protein [Acholeplasmatales bacterium]|nr:DAK2 domain-containing protein [Acholeplasmatales bacterium]
MSVVSIDVALFRKMVINGAINLKNNHAEIDQLNVFPVPDGDTGTNMSMTVTSGIRELEACESSSIIDNAKVLSRGALMGARGNSGVILSQFFRGMYVGLKELQHNYLDIEDFMSCLESGCKVAYKAVMTPIEGTILTVVRVAAEKTRENISKYTTIDELLSDYVGYAKEALDSTPTLLPVLKEAGVVDSGGAGFLAFATGMDMALRGEMLNAISDEDKTQGVEGLKYFYQVELLLELKKPEAFDVKALNGALSLLGDKVTLTKEAEGYKVELNTDRPGRALEICQKNGEFIVLKIENLKVKNKTADTTVQTEEMKDMGLVSVCFGEGIVETFRELGVDYVIEGGQTMNPSTESFVEAIKAVNAKNVIIIPNNGNVVMAAKQAATLVEGINVEVLPAKTIAQGYASLINYNPEGSLEENVEAMTEQIKHVVSGEITYSIRDTEIGGVEIHSGDFMGISNGNILVSTAKKEDCLNELLSRILNEDSEIITIFLGKDVTDEERDVLEETCLKYNPDVDVEVIEGQQDIYSYIIAVE